MTVLPVGRRDRSTIKDIVDGDQDGSNRNELLLDLLVLLFKIGVVVLAIWVVKISFF